MAKKLTPKDFFNTFLPYVRPIALKYNVPVSVLLAQIAIESGWLSSLFSQKYYNLTGMKATGSTINGIWDGAKSTANTKEDYDGDGKQDAYKLAFRVYKNYTQSIEDLAHRHAIRFKFNLNSVGNDINSFIDKVVSTGYATGTGYYNAINDTIDKYKLYDLDKGAKFIKKTKATPKAQATTTNTATPSGAKKK